MIVFYSVRIYRSCTIDAVNLIRNDVTCSFRERKLIQKSEYECRVIKCSLIRLLKNETDTLESMVFSVLQCSSVEHILLTLCV